MPTNLKQAIRTLRNQPLFTAVAVLTLALGIGANTAVFSVVHGVLLRDLPFVGSDHLVTLRLETRVPIFSKAEFLYLKETSSTYADMGAVGGGRGAVLVGAGPARAITTSQMTANLLPVLGIAPVIGRGFEPSEETSGRPVILISEQLWATAFGADPNILGRAITLDGRNGPSRLTVVGVLPASVQLLHPERVDAWSPVDLSADLRAKSAGVQIVGRLGTDVTAQAAQLEFLSILNGLLDLTNVYPAGYELTGRVVPLEEWIIGDRGHLLWLLLGAAGFVLVIACANVANLFLVRFARRRREFALRTALGASRMEMSSMALAEGLIVAVAGGGLGILLAMWSHGLMLDLLPADLPRRGEIGLDLVVLATTLGAAVIAAGVFALVPAWSMHNADLRGILSSGKGSPGAGRGASRPQRTIITIEIALALVLTLGTGLMIKTVLMLRQQNTGVDANDVVAITLQHPVNERTNTFYEAILERTRALPGVVSAALTYHVPLSGSNSITTLRLAEHPTIAPDDDQTVGFQIVSDDYFRTMGIPVIAGGVFSPSPAEAASQIVVSEAFVRQYWPDVNPIGQLVTGSGERRVVGVVGDTRHRGVQLEPRPEAYFPLSSFQRGDMSLMVRSILPPGDVTTSVRSIMAGLDPNVPITTVQIMHDVIESSFATERRTLELLSVFSVLALTLGGIGVYGIISYAVSQQRRELGIRLALGAPTPRVTRMVLTWGLTNTATGVGVGLALSFGLTRLMENQLFGVTATDPSTLLGAVLVLIVIATAAALMPAVRAARIQPIEVLRDEA